ncbi:MAG: hypothetical protein ABR587_06175 [Candidatus Binatia bacterium]
MNDHVSGALWLALVLWLALAAADYANQTRQYASLKRLVGALAPYIETWGFRYFGDLSSRLRFLDEQGRATHAKINRGGTLSKARQEMIRVWLEKVEAILKVEAPELYLEFTASNFVADIFSRTGYESRNNRISYDQTIALNSGLPVPKDAVLNPDEIDDLVRLDAALDRLTSARRSVEGITVLATARNF